MGWSAPPERFAFTGEMIGGSVVILPATTVPLS
jgi:hypothetical protein